MIVKIVSTDGGRNNRGRKTTVIAEAVAVTHAAETVSAVVVVVEVQTENAVV